jgi:CRP/FNR family transcriptional regulator
MLSPSRLPQNPPGNPLLDSLSEASRIALLEQGQLREFAAGETLFVEGDVGGMMLFLLQGSVQLEKTTARGRRQVMCDATPARCGGLCMMFMAEPALASLHAVTEGQMLLIDADVFQELANQDSSLCHAAWASTSTCLQHMSGLVGHLSFRKVSERIALALLENTTNDGDLIRWTQAELAAEVGTTREVVARCLAGFQMDGAVRLGRGRVTVLKREKLAAEIK